MTTTLHRTWCARPWSGISLICLPVLCFAAISVAFAQEPPTGAADAAIVKPFVSDTTFLIVKVDPRQIGLPDLADTLNSMSPDAEAAYRQAFQRVGAGIEQLRTLAKDQIVYATIGIPISEARIPVFIFVKAPSDAAAAKLLNVLKGELKTNASIHGEYVAVTHANGMSVAESLAAYPASEREAIADAFQAVAGYPAQILLLPPPHVRRTVRELSPELPPQLGGGPSSVLTDGLQWAALGIDPAQLQAQLVVHSSSEAAARDLAAHLPKMLQSAYDAAPQIHDRIPPELAQTLLGWLEPQVEGQQVTIHIDGLEKTTANLKLLATIFRTIEDKTRRHRNRDRFRQILLAMHNYYDVNKVFPPADKYRGEDGKHHLSWRVHILPYIEQGGKLYNEFHLDEPWDSPHNKKLIARVPDIYMTYSLGIPPAVPIELGYTTFLTPVGKDTAFGGAESVTFPKFTDGTSNTVVLVEVKSEKAVPWTAPDDYAFDPKDPAAELLIGVDRRWLCGLADGSIHQLRGDIPPDTFLHLFQMSDGNPIDFNKIR